MERPGMIQSSDVTRVALRTPLLQATWNYERQQGLGWAWCFQPILERLYPEAAERRRRLADHTAYFNTQPTLASLALGAIAGLEARVARGEPPELVHRARQALGSALAAMGDRLFWATLRPFAATMGVIAALGGGSWRGAVVMWLIYNAVHLPLRFAGVSWGARRGPEVLDAALRRAIDRMVRSLSLIGSAAVGVAVAMTLAPGGEPHTVAFQAGLLGGIGLGLLTAMRARPSPTQWALGVGALALAAGWWR
jgi:PTS system mannose-specific IID component